MHKTSVTESPPQNPELKESTNTLQEGGPPRLRLVGKNDISGTTATSDLPRSRTPKSPSCFMERSPDFNWVRFNTIAHELPPLFMANWRELEHDQEDIPLDPDWDRYYQLDALNILRVLTVRDGARLAGYVFLMVMPHLHHKSTLFGQVDMMWLDPALRSGWTGVKLIKTLIRDARTMGVAKLTVATKNHFMDNRLTKLLQRYGLKPTETVHTMRLT